MAKLDKASDPNRGAKYINRLNKIKVLNIIRTIENLCRADIARISKFSDHISFIIGNDLGTTNIYGVHSNFDANIVAEVRRPNDDEALKEFS